MVLEAEIELSGVVPWTRISLFRTSHRWRSETFAPRRVLPEIVTLRRHDLLFNNLEQLTGDQKRRQFFI
jgi:hypothetical protein